VEGDISDLKCGKPNAVYKSPPKKNVMGGTAKIICPNGRLIGFLTLDTLRLLSQFQQNIHARLQATNSSGFTMSFEAWQGQVPL